MMLTEAEVAQRLRCSASKVKRLRLSGVLPYLPGRPVLVVLSDLENYIESQKRGGTAKRADEQHLVDDARQWAINQTLLKTRKRGRT